MKINSLLSFLMLTGKQTVGNVFIVFLIHCVLIAYYMSFLTQLFNSAMTKYAFTDLLHTL